MKLPDVSSLLPSKAREALEEYFFQCLVQSGLDYQAQPKYDFLDDRDVYALNGTYVYGLAEKAYDAAEKRYNLTHPLCHDNEKQKTYRAGLGYAEAI